MRKTLVCVLGVTLLLTLCQGLQSDTAGVQPVSSSQAIDRATEFFVAVGWQDAQSETSSASVADSASAAVSDNVSVSDLAGLSAEVDSEKGYVRYAMNEAINRRSTDKVIGVTPDIANKKAIEYLQAAGVPLDDAEIYSSKLMRLSYPEPVHAEWEVRFRRVHNGYPFHSDDFISVALDPADGSLCSFGYNFRSPLPDSTNPQISQDGAVSMAADYLAGLGMKAGSVISADLQIVQPDDYWEYIATGTAPPAPTTSRLAWVVVFNGPWEKTEVWIDAELGNALGGVRSLSITKSKVGFPGMKPSGALSIVSNVSTGKRSGSEVDAKALSSLFASKLAYLSTVKPSDGKYSITVQYKDHDRSLTFGYSASDHVLALLSKKFGGKEIKGDLAWRTDEGIESLIANCTGQ